MQSGVMGMSYSDAEDPARRLRLHSISDAFTLAVMLALGWPITPIGEIADQAESVCDDLYYAWEESLDILDQAEFHQFCLAHNADDIDAILRKNLTSLQVAIAARDDFSAKHKLCLIHHVASVMCLVREILIQSTSTCGVALPVVSR
jgi:hypothetical protein